MKRPRPVVQKLMRTGGPRCPVACFETLISKCPAELQKCGLSTFLPYGREEIGVNESVACTTASWSECDQPVHEEYGKGRWA